MGVVLAVEQRAERAHGTAPRTSVLIVEARASFARALGTAIESQPDLEFAGAVPTLDDAMRRIEARAPDVLLMEARCPGGDAIDATRRVTEHNPSVRVILFTAHADVALLAQAASAGACGLLLNRSSLRETLDAIRSACNGGMLVPPSTLSVVLAGSPAHHRAPHANANLALLTPREREVLALMSEGLGPTGVARRLTLSVHTTRSHVKSIMSKLGAHSQLEAVVVAVRNGMVDGPTADASTIGGDR